MAAKYADTFVSKTEIDKKKETRRSYFEAELDNARSEFEAKRRLQQLKEQRGETKWMLPSLSHRITDETKEVDHSVGKQKKRRNEKKIKKHKKEKKLKKQKSNKRKEKTLQSSASSDASSEDEWVEKSKEPTQEHHTLKKKEDEEVKVVESATQSALLSEAAKREDWMLSSSLLDYVSGSSESRADARVRRRDKEIVLEKPPIDKPGQHPKELNPYWKDGGSGVPIKNIESCAEQHSGDAGSGWIQKAVKRAKEQARDQGRELEDVIAERWGSMEKLNALLKASERRSRPNADTDTSSSWRRPEQRHGWKKSSPVDHERTHQNEDDKRPTTRVPSIEKGAKRQYNCRQPPSGVEPSQNISVEPIEKAAMNTTTPRDATSSESEDSECDSESADEKQPVATEPVSEKEINEISAKILRAELMGNEDLVAQLKSKLEAGRQVGTEASVSGRSCDRTIGKEEEDVLLTRTDRHGNVYPLKTSGEETEARRKRRKLKRIDTHDAKGNRLRYHHEDDTTSLKSMIEEEKLTSAEDHQRSVLSRLAGKLGNTMGDYYTLDDMFETSSANKESRGVKDEKAKKRAISDHHKNMAQQSKCRFCFDSSEIAKHLIISIASQVYMTLPSTSDLTEGHCIITPMQHTLASTYLDEDVMHEVTMFKSSLVKMFREKDEDVIFLETFQNIKRQFHMFIECIPVPKEVGDIAPIYFKKALQECEDEWAQNKKVVTIDKARGIKKAIPKGLPYFAVEFGLDGGFGHIIENEESFQHYFGREIIGSVLDLDPVKWRRPSRQSFHQQKSKVLQFAEQWKNHDWTRHLT